ncbi:ABC transporter permease [Candidatus Micrarchaeota archaeon]|nr:ABC transporter permease [Candidatus Micrarchaeota archaeon]
MLPLALRELRETLKDKVFLASAVIQFLVISTLLFIFHFYSILNTATIPVQVTLDEYDEELIHNLQESGVSVIVETSQGRDIYSSNSAPDRRFRYGIEASLNSRTSTIETDVASIYSGFAISRIKEASEAHSFDEALDQYPFEYETQGTTGKDFQFLSLGYGFIVPMAVILPAFVVMSLTVQSILLERKKRIIELVLVSPLSNLDIALAKILPYVAVSGVFSFFWLSLVLQALPLFNFELLLLVSFVFALFMVSLSVIISSFSATVKEANAWSSLAGMIIPFLVVLPYSPFSEYFPLAIMARVAASPLALDSLIPVLVFTAVSALVFGAAVYSIGHLRQTAS